MAKDIAIIFEMAFEKLGFNTYYKYTNFYFLEENSRKLVDVITPPLRGSQGP